MTAQTSQNVSGHDAATSGTQTKLIYRSSGQTRRLRNLSKGCEPSNMFQWMTQADGMLPPLSGAQLENF